MPNPTFVQALSGLVQGGVEGIRYRQALDRQRALDELQKQQIESDLLAQERNRQLAEFQLQQLREEAGERQRLRGLQQMPLGQLMQMPRASTRMDLGQPITEITPTRPAMPTGLPPQFEGVPMEQLGMILPLLEQAQTQQQAQTQAQREQELYDLMRAPLSPEEARITGLPEGTDRRLVELYGPFSRQTRELATHRDLAAMKTGTDTVDLSGALKARMAYREMISPTVAVTVARKHNIDLSEAINPLDKKMDLNTVMYLLAANPEAYQDFQNLLEAETDYGVGSYIPTPERSPMPETGGTQETPEMQGQGSLREVEQSILSEYPSMVKNPYWTNPETKMMIISGVLQGMSVPQVLNILATGE